MTSCTTFPFLPPLAPKKLNAVHRANVVQVWFLQKKKRKERAGFEPATLHFAGECSTTELTLLLEKQNFCFFQPVVVFYNVYW